MARPRALNAPRTRGRKFQLAQRDGQRCAYCLAPFATLREATLDHVAPLSLLRTWSARHLVLACRPCNSRKADRLPLSIALLLLWSTGPTPPIGLGPQSAEEGDGVDSSPTVQVNSPVFTAAFTMFTPPVSTTFPPAAWVLLARLAHARHLALTSVTSGVTPRPADREQPSEHRERSGAHQPVRARDRVGRPVRTRLCAARPTQSGAAFQEAA